MCKEQEETSDQRVQRKERSDDTGVTGSTNQFHLEKVSEIDRFKPNMSKLSIYDENDDLVWEMKINKDKQFGGTSNRSLDFSIIVDFIEKALSRAVNEQKIYN